MPLTISEDEYHMHCDELDGLCLNCGAFTCGGVEPFDENIPCEGCGNDAVCGTELALSLGALVLTS